MLVHTWGSGDVRIRVIYPERILPSIKSYFINVVEFRYNDPARIREWFLRWEDARKWVAEQTAAGRRIAEYINSVPRYGLRWIAAHQYAHIQIPSIAASPKYRWKNYYDKQELMDEDKLRVREPWKITLFGEWWSKA